MIRFSDRQIWPQESHGLWIFEVNRADWQILKTLDRGSAVIFGTDSGFYLSYVGILGPKRNLDHRSFFSLGRNVLSSSKLFPLSKEVIVIGTALCYSHQVCCLLYYWDKINRSIHMYQMNLLLNLYTSVSGCVCGFRFEQKFWRIDGFGAIKARIGGFAYPY